VIGMGALDDLEYAKDFQNQTNSTFQLVWDETFETWRTLGVSSQHTVIVFDSDGTQLDTWNGFDGGRILDTLR
jgi:hypothetical protein